MSAADTKIPDGLFYTREHEWLKLDGNRVRLGITDYAQDALTDVVFAELPDAGETFAAGDSMGVVESVKSVSDIYMPVAGTVVEANAALEENPELMNDDPYGKGWFCIIEVDDVAAVQALLDADGYRKVLAAA